jgi:4-amino-4-deoxy-L-arabinose transferase-like glycosyltransferase
VLVGALGLALRCWALGGAAGGDPFAATNPYYAVGVLSMLDGWHNAVFNAFDPAGFVSLDKPPVAFWFQALSARLLGFGPFSVLIPQAMEGLGAILLLNHLVARRFGATAGLFAALLLAVTPISIAVDRSNNADSCLALTLLLAAWPLILAAERGSLRLLLLAMAVIGVAFNVKMLAAFVVVPAFALTYLLTAPVAWPRRIGHLAAGGVVLFAVSFAWCAAYDLTPPDQRPFVDSSTDNSMLELVFGHNGVQRFVRRGAAIDPSQESALSVPAAEPDRVGRRGGYGGRGAARTPVGPLRLAAPLLACQVAWFLPFAVAGILFYAAGSRRRHAAARSMPVITRDNDPTARISILLWGGWIIVTGIVYSYAGGIFQLYYLDTLAAPLAALAGIGLARLWRVQADISRANYLLPIGLLVALGWESYIAGGFIARERGLDEGLQHLLSAVNDWAYGLAVGFSVALLGLALGWIRGRLSAPGRQPFGARLGFAIAISVLVAVPACWGLGSIAGTTSAAFPSADLPIAATAGAMVRARSADPRGTEKLVRFLMAHHGGQRFLAATLDSRQAAPIILATGLPVLSIGGFSGNDPILSPAKFAAMVTAGQVRFMLIEAEAPGRENPRQGGDGGGFGADRLDRQRDVVAWVRANGKAVDPADWLPPLLDPQPGGESSARSGGRRPTPELYDLRS